jgi:hypothetical protein
VPGHSDTRFDAAEVLRRLARPRLVGTDGWHATRETVRSLFAGLGYDSQTLPFDFSPVPGRCALPTAGAILLLDSALCGALLLADRPTPALIITLAAGAAIALIALSMPLASDRLRWRALRGENLLFQRPGTRARWILMAHYDSKSQLVPLLLRAPAGFVGGLAWLVLTGIAVLGHIEPPGVAGPFIAGIAGMLAGAAFLFSWAGNASPGALDNASGVATLLAVAAQDRGGDIAFLVSDAEEMGLVGARAAARVLPDVEGVINIDGIDDTGEFRVFDRYGLPRRGTAPALRHALFAAARDAGVPITGRDAPVGILLDHMSIARAGTPALTLLRGSLRSLARVHLPQDDLQRLTGNGVNEAAALLGRALHVLRGVAPSTDPR